MKDSYVYTAEYISTVDGITYLNVDLGFSKWFLVPFEKLDTKYKWGTRLLIESTLTTHDKRCKYQCQVLNKLS